MPPQPPPIPGAEELESQTVALRLIAALLALGAAWLLSDRVQVDTMLARGLNRRTPDLAWTVGLSFKY